MVLLRWQEFMEVIFQNILSTSIFPKPTRRASTLHREGSIHLSRSSPDSTLIDGADVADAAAGTVEDDIRSSLHQSADHYRRQHRPPTCINSRSRLIDAEREAEDGWFRIVFRSAAAAGFFKLGQLQPSDVF